MWALLALLLPINVQPHPAYRPEQFSKTVVVVEGWDWGGAFWVIELCDPSFSRYRTEDKPRVSGTVNGLQFVEWGEDGRAIYAERVIRVEERAR